MELRQVRYFLTLSETLNFTRAAEVCNVAQPTLTQAIKKLEDEMGGPLIHRERGNTHLTQLGEMVLPFLQQVLESSNAASQIAREIATGTRVPISFGISDVVPKAALIPALRETCASEEGIELHVEGGRDPDLARRLEDGALQLILVDETAVGSDRLRFHPVYSEALSVLMPERHPLAGHNGLMSGDLAVQPWISVIDAPIHETLADSVMGVQPDWAPRHRTTRAVEAQVLCQAGGGLTLVGSHEPRLPGLVSAPLFAPRLSRTVGLAEARGRQMSGTALAFARMLRAICYG